MKNKAKTTKQNRKHNVMSMPALNLKLNDTDLTRDVLPKGDYVFVVSDAEFSESKKTPGNWNLHLTLKLASDETSQRGKFISKGYQVQTWMPLQQSENEKAPDFKVGLVKCLMAVFGVTEVAEVPDLTEELLPEFKNREVIVSLNMEDNEEFGASNSVKGFKLAAQ